MDFNKITLYSLTNLIDFWMPGGTESPSYLIKDITGLGPPDYDVTIVPKLDYGGDFQYSRPVSREIVIRLELCPNYGAGETASSLRRILYSLVGGLTSTSLTFKNNDTFVSKISGYLTKFEIVPFSKDPEVQMTIKCPDSYLSDNGKYLGSLPLDDETGRWIFANIGEVPVGFEFVVQLGLNASQWYFVPAPLSPGFAINYSFLVDDQITLDTRDGSKNIWLKRGTDPKISILPYIINMTWPKIKPGGQVYWIKDQATSTVISYSYTPLYMGF